MGPLLLLAQQPDPISGGAGWVGAGLLGLVLGWLLLKHLPDKDRQADAKDAKHAEAMREIASRHAEAVRLVVENCREELAKDREVFERRHLELAAMLQRIHDSAREGIHATRNLDNTIRLRSRLVDAFQSLELPGWSKTLDGVLMSWNLAAERLLGHKQGEAVGRSVYDLIVPADKRAEEQEILRRIAAGESVEEYRSERRARDGHRVPLMLVTSAIRDQTGRVIGASTIAREVV